MTDDPDRVIRLGEAHWRVQPRWVKLLVVFVGLPAWLTAGALLLSGRIGGTLLQICFGLFAAVSLITTAFIFRAYWRMDL